MAENNFENVFEEREPSAVEETCDDSNYDNEPLNYCDRSHRLGDMVTHARKRVFHQDEALDHLELALNDYTYHAIALVGSSGVGKSLTALVLAEHFPWPEMVRIVSWRDTPHLWRVQDMLNGTDECGQTLILIDDMTPQNVKQAAVIKEMVRVRKEVTKDPALVTVIFIFTVNRRQPIEEYEFQMEDIARLDRTHVIVYAALQPSHIKECFGREVTIPQSKLDEIIKSGAVEELGCKALRLSQA